MGDEDKGFLGRLAIAGDDFLDQALVAGVEAVHGLVEDEQLGLLHKGAGQEHQALLATGEAEEGAVGNMADAEDGKPTAGRKELVGRGVAVEAGGIEKA